MFLTSFFELIYIVYRSNSGNTDCRAFVLVYFSCKISVSYTVVEGVVIPRCKNTYYLYLNSYILKSCIQKSKSTRVAY